MNIIQQLIELSDEYGLTTEVVYSALQYMKEDPTLSIEEAITHGYNEWVK